MFAKIIKCEQFLSQNKGIISDSITQCWTPQAIECWELKQKCSACSVGLANYSFDCQMHKVVKILEKTIGTPYEVKETA